MRVYILASGFGFLVIAALLGLLLIDSKHKRPSPFSL